MSHFKIRGEHSETSHIRKKNTQSASFIFSAGISSEYLTNPETSVSSEITDRGDKNGYLAAPSTVVDLIRSC